MLTREDFRSAARPDTEQVQVTIGEKRGIVLVRGMTARERDKFDFAAALNRKTPERISLRATLVAACTLDGDGRQLFTPADETWLAEQPASLLNPIFEVAQRLSGLGESAVKSAESDFGDARNGDSSTGSPDISGSPSLNSSTDATRLNSLTGSPTSG